MSSENQKPKTIGEGLFKGFPCNEGRGVGTRSCPVPDDTANGLEDTMTNKITFYRDCSFKVRTPYGVVTLPLTDVVESTPEEDCIASNDTLQDWMSQLGRDYLVGNEGARVCQK